MKKVRHILASKKSDGDAFLGEGVYDHIPDWVDPDAQENNYRAMWNKFTRWHSANVYVRATTMNLLLERLNIVKAIGRATFASRRSSRSYQEHGPLPKDVTRDYKKLNGSSTLILLDWERA